MNRHLLHHILFALTLLIGVSCHKSEPEDPNDGENPEAVTRTIVVYAINRSSLASDFKDDCREMLTAMSQLDEQKYRLLIYRTDSDTECGLYRAVRNEAGEFVYEKVKDYVRDVTSTHPDRISEVLSDALSLYPNSAYDLIFWGHGMSWKPYFTDHTVNSPMLYSYGGEYNPTGSKLDWTEIDELAAAVPDHRFQTIWFDCCYMTGIEVIYEFRDKCANFIGYPTEVWQYGMQYDQVIPYLMSDTPDLKGAAKKFFDYYNDSSDPVTVAVVDMTKIEKLADVARTILSSGDERPSVFGLINYSRMSSSPFYDFGQFFGEIAELNGAFEAHKVLLETLNDVVIYHAESRKDFTNKEWDTSKISGLSTHFYRGEDTPEEDYYRTLAWFHRVYQ